MNDLLFKIVYLSQEEFDDYVAHIRASNIPKFTQGGLVHILKEVREHTEMARKMGWLNT